MLVISCIAISHRCKRTNYSSQLVVNIKASLQGKETFWTLVGVLVECLDVEIADVAAYLPFGGKGEILSYAIVHSTREILVESHIMGSHTNNIIGTAVAETNCHVQF